MNNLVFFKGVLRGVENKLIEKKQTTLSRIEIDVDEFFFDPVEMIKHPTTNNYYLTKFNWRKAKDYEIDKEYFFVCKTVYKRVESRKATNADGTPFTYGSFDFVLCQIFKTKEELRAYFNETIFN